jgi:CDP-diacylglycerol pyrophosphatase
MARAERVLRFGVAAFALLAAPARADRLALWSIVHDQCAPHAAEGDDPPRPCIEVDPAGGALLKDLHGVAQLLEIPTARVTGIEDPAVLADDAPDYFALAWRERWRMNAYLKASPPREALAITVNSQFSRSQDQLHLHIDCLIPEVAKALADYAPHLDAQWRPMEIALSGRRYWARRVNSADLEGVRPFRRLADDMPDARREMGLWSLAAVPVSFDGRPGFALLADSAGLEGGGHAEDLQDHDCALAR